MASVLVSVFFLQRLATAVVYYFVEVTDSFRVSHNREQVDGPYLN